MPVTFRVRGKDVILRLRMNDTITQIKEQLAVKGLNANDLMLGQTRIDDNATVATSGLYAFSVVNCMLFLSLSQRGIWVYILLHRHVVSLRGVVGGFLDSL